nr:protein scarlet [Nicrophorus vespilloides]
MSSSGRTSLASSSSSSFTSTSRGNGEIDLDVLKRTIKQDDHELVERKHTPTHFNRSYDRWSPHEEGATIAWRDLNVFVRDRKGDPVSIKTIISGVTGAIKPGSLVALMGSSGSGKSTLMSALAYRTSKDLIVEGDILINGRAIGDYMRHMSGFMHQEDLFVGSLTVYEHMEFMARMKLDRRVSRREREEKIDDILRKLGLARLRNTRIGLSGEKKVLSGGEKKRLAFAAELITDPQILFCDEPTTGLDSYSAQKLVEMMNDLAAKGKTIVCTIHQPSSQLFAMFSQLILLEDGRIAYMGSASSADDFFNSMGYGRPANYNPADFFVRTLAPVPGSEEASRMAVKRISNNFSLSDHAKEVDVIVQYEFHMGAAIQHSNFDFRANFKEIFCWTRFALITRRLLTDTFRNPATLYLRLIQSAAISFMVGMCYIGTDPLTQNGIQSLQGTLAIIVCENTFPAMYGVLAEFPEGLPLFMREYKSGMYNTGTYYAAKVISMLPVLMVEPILFLLILYYLCGLRNTLYSVVICCLTSALIMNTACSCGLLFSNAFESVASAMLWLIPFDYILMITSGFYMNLESISVYLSWTKNLSWLMYGMEAMTIIQWENVNNITCEHSDPRLPCVSNGEQVLKQYGFSEDHLIRDLVGMIVLCLSFHTLSYLFLLRKIRKY